MGGLKFFELIPSLDLKLRNQILEKVKQIKDIKAIVIDCNYAGRSKFENDIRNEFFMPKQMALGTYKGLVKEDDIEGTIK